MSFFKNGGEWQSLSSLKTILTACFYLIFIVFNLVFCVLTPGNVCVIKIYMNI